jgi:Zn-dependent protease with chaperone function
LLALLAIQFAALAVYLPRALAAADRRAMELTGDPEAFVSAVAGLARFNGAALPEASLREIAARGGILPERMLAGRIAAAEDRYPTTGSYATTGLP